MGKLSHKMCACGEAEWGYKTSLWPTDTVIMRVTMKQTTFKTKKQMPSIISSVLAGMLYHAHHWPFRGHWPMSPLPRPQIFLCSCNALPDSMLICRATCLRLHLTLTIVPICSIMIYERCDHRHFVASLGVHTQLYTTNNTHNKAVNHNQSSAELN